MTTLLAFLMSRRSESIQFLLPVRPQCDSENQFGFRSTVFSRISMSDGTSPGMLGGVPPKCSVLAPPRSRLLTILNGPCPSYVPSACESIPLCCIWSKKLLTTQQYEQFRRTPVFRLAIALPQGTGSGQIGIVVGTVPAQP